MPESIQSKEAHSNPSPFNISISRAALIGVIVLALFWLAYVSQASRTTLTGQRVYEMQQELERVKRENMQMEVDIAALTTPARIAERARALGLRPTTTSQIQYVVIRDYPIVNPTPMVEWSPIVNPATAPTAWDVWRARLGLAPNPRPSDLLSP
jgi:cell division protein FtsL